MTIKGVAYMSFLIAQSSLTIIITFIGNTYLLLFALHRKEPKTHPMKFLLINFSCSNLLVSCIAMPFHVLKILTAYLEITPADDICCLGRYFFTFVVTTSTLMSLTALCGYRRDQIVRVPFGKQPIVRPSRRTITLVLIWAVSLIPNAGFLTGYLYLFISKNVSPCRPPEAYKKTTHYYLGLAEGVKTGILFGVCVTFIIKAVPRIRTVLKNQATRMRISSVSGVDIRKVNATFYFAAAFLVMWVPFGIIAIVASMMPDTFYEDVFDAGYTVAYGSFAATPLVYALTDRNFKNFIRRKHKKVVRRADKATKATKYPTSTLPRRNVTRKPRKPISEDQFRLKKNSLQKAETQL